jgi:hypothetical protein
LPPAINGLIVARVPEERSAIALPTRMPAKALKKLPLHRRESSERPLTGGGGYQLSV